MMQRMNELNSTQTCMLYINLESVTGSAATVNVGQGLPEDQSEIIFIGTGTSEGIPRVSCLTNPLKKCPVQYQGFLLC